MKNTLAENLLRFGVKNLSESDRTRLTEEAYTVIPLTISLPYKKDPTSGQMVFDTSKWVNIFAANEKGTDGTSLENYNDLRSLTFGQEFVPLIGSKKDASGNITARFSVYGPEKKNLVKYLTGMVGKTLPGADKSVMVTLGFVKGGNDSKYAAGSTFKMYDTGAATPTAPAPAGTPK
jgi:hypothetical protein